MLTKGKTVIGMLHKGSVPLEALYKGGKKIWEAVSSCFGSGVWREDKPWKDTDAWKE